MFNDFILKGLSKEKAAFETWTGKRALEQGFNKVKIDKLVPEKEPYASVTVTFYR